MSYLIKHTKAEFKLVEQYRKKQQKLEAQKAKKKAKKKTKQGALNALLKMPQQEVF